MSLGSFWSGIKMRKMSLATGKLSDADPKTYAIASRKRPEQAEPAKPGFPPDWEAIEAPFVVHHGGYPSCAECPGIYAMPWMDSAMR
jgi:arabinan endo-1,5-alpha-L-arabinosidase